MTFNSGDSHRLSRLSQLHAENRHFGSGKMTFNSGDSHRLSRLSQLSSPTPKIAISGAGK